jgi:hypothetical protein
VEVVVWRVEVVVWRVEVVVSESLVRDIVVVVGLEEMWVTDRVEVRVDECVPVGVVVEVEVVNPNGKELPPDLLLNS